MCVCVLHCAGNTVTSLLRHFQSAAVLIHPPRAAFLLPGNRDALSLKRMMSGWFDNALLHVKSEHVLGEKIKKKTKPDSNDEIQAWIWKTALK